MRFSVLSQRGCDRCIIHIQGQRFALYTQGQPCQACDGPVAGGPEQYIAGVAECCLCSARINLLRAVSLGTPFGDFQDAVYKCLLGNIVGIAQRGSAVHSHQQPPVIHGMVGAKQIIGIALTVGIFHGLVLQISFRSCQIGFKLLKGPCLAHVKADFVCQILIVHKSNHGKCNRKRIVIIT